MSFDHLKNSITETFKDSLHFKNENMDKKLNDLNLPHRRIENWKYTSLGNLFEAEFQIPKTETNKASAPKNKDQNFIHIDIENGELRYCNPELEEYLEFSELLTTPQVLWNLSS